MRITNLPDLTRLNAPLASMRRTTISCIGVCKRRGCSRSDIDHAAFFAALYLPGVATRLGNIGKKTYNSRDSLVVTHPTTNLPACGLSTAERTGSPVLHTLWSYVLG
ncbi:hypothetical protein N7526_006811 [Penicillium atrosanguineum]|nr:hypothetical protein N7526_006811 [Penicillium atrosanguineum]